MNPCAFIASSAESLGVAEHVQRLLSPDIESRVWSQEFFKPSSDTLGSLLTRTMLFDVGIVLFTKDDFLVSRETVWESARDNAIFEAGLLFGRLGRSRSFVIIEKGVKIPSDLSGVTTKEFTKDSDGGSYCSLETVVKSIATEIKSQSRISGLGVLPSTALAIGYFDNFVKRVAEEISRGACIKFEKTGDEVKASALEVAIGEAVFEDAPRIIADCCREQNLQRGYLVRDSNRNFNVYFRVDGGTAVIVDIPSTLSVLDHTIKMVFPDSGIGPNDDAEEALQRERHNFVQAVSYLIKRDPITSRFVKVVERM